MTQPSQKKVRASKEPLRVGIIGASAERGWAKESHVPAIQGLAGLELAAVATSSQPTADAAAKAFGARAGYGKADDLIHDPEVDLVAICVKVPDHRALVLEALSAGKHIYCEWPLGRNLAETEEMATAARAAGVHVAIGLQARMNPAVGRARELISAGAIGRLLSTNIVSTTAAFGPKVERAMAFGEDAGNGVTLVTIQGAHTLDLAIAVLGPLADATALATTQFPEVEIGDDPKRHARSTPDHLLVQARLTGGGAMSVEVAGGRPPDATPFRWEMIGEKGNLMLNGGAMRGFQSGRLRLSVNGETQTIDEGETSAMPDMAANVAGVYAALRADIVSGTSTAPDFGHAIRLARFIDEVILSARTGTRKMAAGWPM